MSDIEPIQRRRGRPPKGSQDPHKTRQLLIRSGLEVLTEKGYSAAGLDEILRRVGVPKGSFYHYFSSKDEFIKELISAYNAFFTHKLDKFLLSRDLSPLARIDAFVADAMASMAEYEFKRGCLVGNLGQEMPSLPESFRAQLQGVFVDWQQRISVCLQQAQAAGDLNETVDCDEMAYIFWIGWEGAVLRARLEQSRLPMKVFAESFLAAIRR